MSPIRATSTSRLPTISALTLLARLLVADNGVHSLDLEVAGNDLQVGVDALQLGLLQLGADVFNNQVDRHQIIAPDTWGEVRR